MLSSRNEWILIGLLISYLAFIPSLQMIRDILSTSVGKAAALGGIVYVYKYVSCSAALLLVIGYVRCASMNREMFDVPPTMNCPEGTALDSTATPPVCRSSSSVTPPVLLHLNHQIQLIQWVQHQDQVHRLIQCHPMLQ